MKPDIQKIVLIAIVFVLVIYLDFTFILKSQMNTVTIIQQKIAKLDKDIRDLQSGLLKMQNVKKKEEAGSVKKFISEGEITGLLQDISELANKNSVRIIQIKPNKEPVYRRDKKASKDELSLLLINMELVCGYHNLGKFINDLERKDVLIILDSLKILPNQTDYLSQRVDLVLKVYVK